MRLLTEKLTYSTSKYPKDILKSLKFGPKWQFLYSKPILLVIFVTIATVEFKEIPKLHTSVILLINQSEEIGEKQFSVFGPKGAKLSP